jgi:hypothetical protein
LINRFRRLDFQGIAGGVSSGMLSGLRMGLDAARRNVEKRRQL